jgi:hypothetical protein
MIWPWRWIIGEDFTAKRERILLVFSGRRKKESKPCTDVYMVND